MKDLATLLLVGAAAFLVYKALENKPLKISGNGSDKQADDKKTLPPLPKDEKMQKETHLIIEEVEIPMASTFDINVVDPKFGSQFFNNGVSAY